VHHCWRAVYRPLKLVLPQTLIPPTHPHHNRHTQGAGSQPQSRGHLPANTSNLLLAAGAFIAKGHVHAGSILLAVHGTIIKGGCIGHIVKGCLSPKKPEVRTTAKTDIIQEHIALHMPQILCLLRLQHEHRAANCCQHYTVGHIMQNFCCCLPGCWQPWIIAMCLQAVAPTKGIMPLEVTCHESMQASCNFELTVPNTGQWHPSCHTYHVSSRIWANSARQSAGESAPMRATESGMNTMLSAM